MKLVKKRGLNIFLHALSSSLILTILIFIYIFKTTNYLTLLYYFLFSNIFFKLYFNYFFIKWLIYISIISLFFFIFFKFSIFPCHFWISDFYEGCPLIILIFFSTIFKLVILSFFFNNKNKIYNLYIYFIFYNLWGSYGFYSKKN